MLLTMYVAFTVYSIAHKRELTVCTSHSTHVPYMHAAPAKKCNGNTVRPYMSCIALYIMIITLEMFCADCVAD